MVLGLKVLFIGLFDVFRFNSIGVRIRILKVSVMDNVLKLFNINFCIKCCLFIRCLYELFELKD